MTKADKERLVDWQVGLSATGGDESLLCDLIDIFFSEYPKQLTGIREAIASRSGKELHRFAHTLKGGLRYFGESKAGMLALELETQGADENFDHASGMLAELCCEVERLVPELQDYLDARQ